MDYVTSGGGIGVVVMFYFFGLTSVCPSVRVGKERVSMVCVSVVFVHVCLSVC